MKPAEEKKSLFVQTESEENLKEGIFSKPQTTAEEEEKKKKKSEATPDNAAKEEEQKGGIVSAIIDLIRAAIRVVTAVLRAVAKGINKVTNYFLFGDEEEKEEGPEKEKKSFLDFLKDLFGMNKKEKSQSYTAEDSNRVSSGFSAEQSDQQISPELRSQMEGVMKGAQDFLRGRSQQEGKSAKKGGVEVDSENEEESRFQAQSTGLKDREGAEIEKEKNPLIGALQQMVDLVTQTRDPELMKQCQGVLEGVSKESKELEGVTKGLTDKLETVQGEVEKESGMIEGRDPMSAAKEQASGILNDLKRSDSIQRPASVMDDGDLDRDEGPAVSLPQGVGGKGGGVSR